MNKGKKVCFSIICSIVCVSIAIGVFLFTCSTPKQADPTFPTIGNAQEMYTTAIASIDQASAISYTVSYKKEMLLGSEYLSELSQQSIRFTSRNTEDFCGAVEESLNIGDHTVSLTEIYSGNTGYFTVENEKFLGSLTKNDFIERHIPAVLLDKDLYADIQGYDTDDGYQITFQKPAVPENWSDCSAETLVSADGTAYLDSNGNLTKSTYLLSYNLKNIAVRLSVTVQITGLDAKPIVLPSDTENYVQLTYLDAPRMLERASGYLMETDNLNAYYADTIRCEAFGDVRQQTINLTTSSAQSWSAHIETQVTMENTGKTGSRSTLTQTEAFYDGQYTITTNNDSATTKNVDINTMRSHCRDLLVGTILLPQYITQASISEDEDSYLIEYIASDKFAQLIVAEACQTLYQNAAILSGSAQDYKTEEMLCYLRISKDTGLPQASGFSYRGTYIIDTIAYPLVYTAEQTYHTVNNEAGTS